MTDRYEVTSDRLVLGNRGATINAVDIPEGTNIDVLIQAGHLKPLTTTTPKAKPSANSESEA